MKNTDDPPPLCYRCKHPLKDWISRKEGICGMCQRRLKLFMKKQKEKKHITVVKTSKYPWGFDEI